MKEQFEIKNAFKSFDESLITRKVINVEVFGESVELDAYLYNNLPVMSVDTVVIEVYPSSEFYVGYKSEHNYVYTNNLLAIYTKYADSPRELKFSNSDTPLTKDELDSLWQYMYNYTHSIGDPSELAYKHREANNICHTCAGDGYVVDLDDLAKHQITFGENLWELVDNPKIKKKKCFQCNGTGYLR